LAAEFDISMTYMDVRFLVLDLGLTVKDRPAPAAAPPVAGGESLAGQPSAPAAEPATAGGVSVEVDRVVKAGAVASGSVTFSDGVSGSWMIDQFGRLALDTGKAGYRPEEQDVRAFQEKLRSALETRGF